jgi:hypothetical protein
LALRAGLLPIATSELRKSIRLSEEIDPKAELNSDQVAWFHLQLARLLSRGGPNSEATEQFRIALNLAKEPGIKVKALTAWTRYLIRMLRSGETSSSITSPGTELSTALSVLRRYAPDIVSHWAVSTLFCESASECEEISAGLEKAWRQSDQSLQTEQGWYFLGLAGLADLTNADPTASAYAGQALQVWPEHPFRNELELIRQKGSPIQ